MQPDSIPRKTMKLRALFLALASASTALPSSAHAADDFCSRLIVLAINQICQRLPNGYSLCQPVALVGPSPECAIPNRQALVPVPLGPPTLQALAPWAAPWTALAATSAAVAPLPAQAWTTPEAPAATTPTAADLPRIMAATPKPTSESTAAPLAAPASTKATLVAQKDFPPIAAPKAPVAPSAPSAPIPPVVVAATPVAAPAAGKVPAASPAIAAPAATAPSAATRIAASGPTTQEEAAASVDALAHFDFDSAKLTNAGRAVLDAWLAEAPKDKTVRVIGHADRLGPEPYNLKLSLRRAEAVKHYLVGKGIDPRRIQLEAKGESEPVKRCKGGDTPATKACLAPNRRVKIDPE
jgi:outer membrane protein OmpA-like peptidoglycan-associated protein